MLSHASLQGNRDVESSAGRHRTAHPGHRDHRNVLDLHVRRRLRHKDQALIQEVQETLVGLDGAFDSAVAVVAVKVRRGLLDR